MADATSSSITIPASPEAVREVIADLAAYPEWAGGISSVEVLDGDPAAPTRARFTVDSGPVKDTYVLAYDWSGMAADGTGVVSWKLVEGGITRKLDGSYTLSADGAGTAVRYDLAVDIAIAMPGMLKRKAEKRIVDTALKDLKLRVG